MDAVKIIIADKKSSVRRKLSQLLLQNNKPVQIEECENGNKALDFINSLNPDAVFLEIEMSDLTGFEVLGRLKNKHLPHIIFLSTSSDYALQAFEIGALDYIQKPFYDDRLTKSFDRLFERIMEYKNELILPESRYNGPRTIERQYLDRLIIKQSGEYFLIHFGEIIWIESNGNYARIITPDKKYMVRSTLNEFEKELHDSGFFRISRSKIVNLDHIAKIKDHVYGNFMIELKNGMVLKMSKNYRQLLQAYRNF